MTDSYDELLNSKETEVGKWASAVTKLRRELDEAKRVHKIELQENEERHAARLQASLGEAERRWRKARSTAETAASRESELEKEVDSLTGALCVLCVREGGGEVITAALKDTCNQLNLPTHFVRTHTRTHTHTHTHTHTRHHHCARGHSGRQGRAA
jgi:FKBP-type peptidyl-prolyl cis-trans isomerase